MPGSGSDKRQLTAQVLVRMDPVMKEVIGEIGVAIGRQRGTEPLTEATVCREILSRHLGPALVSRGVNAHDPVKKKRSPRPPAPEYLRQVAAFNEVLRETNGTLRQSINLMKIAGQGGLAEQIAEFLPVLKAMADESTAMKKKLEADLEQAA